MQRQRTRTLAVHQMQDQTSCRPVCVRRACHRCQVQTSLHRLFCGMLAQCVPKRQPQTFARRLDVARRRRCGTNLGPRTAGVVGKRVCVSCRAHVSDGARLWSHVDVVTHLLITAAWWLRFRMRVSRGCTRGLSRPRGNKSRKSKAERERENRQGKWWRCSNHCMQLKRNSSRGQIGSEIELFGRRS